MDDYQKLYDRDLAPLKDPIDEALENIAKQIYKNPKQFVDGFRLGLDKIDPMVTIDEVERFSDYWIHSDQSMRLPQIKEFKRFIDRNGMRTKKVSICSFSMCIGDGYLEGHMLNEKKEARKNEAMIKCCPCKVGEYHYNNLNGETFILTEWQKNQFQEKVRNA